MRARIRGIDKKCPVQMRTEGQLDMKRGCLVPPLPQLPRFPHASGPTPFPPQNWSPKSSTHLLALIYIVRCTQKASQILSKHSGRPHLGTALG